jgi:2-oxoglutarate ferredoxin oxidoreductase subunit delta
MIALDNTPRIGKVNAQTDGHCTRPVIPGRPAALLLGVMPYCDTMRFRLRIDKERCKGCVLCVVACAKGLLHMARGFNERGQHYVEESTGDACSGCKNCADMCPEGAIEIEKIEDAEKEDAA